MAAGLPAGVTVAGVLQRLQGVDTGPGGPNWTAVKLLGSGATGSVSLSRIPKLGAQKNCCNV